jgi:ribose-phosphate pyrophosphokinase
MPAEICRIEMKVIPGPASLELGAKIAERMGVESHPAEHRLFPDGESIFRITAEVKAEVVVIVQTTFPDPDKSLLQLFLMTDAAKDAGAKEVVCVVPYLAYARQDKRFLKGESLSLKTTINLLGVSGADKLMVVDVHEPEALGKFCTEAKIELINLSAIPLLAEYLRLNGFKGAYSLSPDEGAVKLAKAAGSVLGGDVSFFTKERDLHTGDIEMVVKDLDVRDRDVVVFDDIVSSGGTTARAVKGLISQGASQVAAACTHGLFMGDARTKILDAGADVLVATDTVHTQTSIVSVSTLIADYLNKM